MAISPDGKYVAYVFGEPGGESLRVHQVATRREIDIVQRADGDFAGLTFSHDGNYIYYVESSGSNYAYQGPAFQIPALGGESRKIADSVSGPMSLSPDDRRIAFFRFAIDHSDLMIANTEGGGEQKLVNGKDGQFIGNAGTAWLPDGKQIATVTSRAGGFFLVSRFLTSPVAKRELGRRSGPVLAGWRGLGMAVGL